MTCLICAILSLTAIFIFFGELTSLTFGSKLTEPYITEMLPAKNIGVIIIKFLYMCNLVCSYPITINPTNTIMESYMFGNTEPEIRPRIEVWLRRLSRFFVVLSAAVLGIVFAKDMEKFLGVLGALLGSPMGMTIPALIHMKLLAETKFEKMIDWLMIVLSIFCLIFSTIMSI